LSLQTLFKLALWITVPVNFSGAVIFSVSALRQLIGLPPLSQNFYGLLIGSWIGLFGVCYLYVAIFKRYDKVFLTIGALGKLSFFVLAVAYFASFNLGFLALLASGIDACLAIIFLAWLWQAQRLKT
jgi:hypothetical protein